MARFVALPASDVIVGRGRGRLHALAPFVEALAEMEAGRIDCEHGETPARLRGLLAEAAHRRGLTTRTSIVENGRALVFKTYPFVRRVRRLVD